MCNARGVSDVFFFEARTILMAAADELEYTNQIEPLKPVRTGMSS